MKLNDVELEEKYTLVTREFDRIYTLSNLLGAYKSNEFNADIIQLGQSIREKTCAEIKEAFSATLLKMLAKAHNRNDLTDPFRYELFAGTGYSSLGTRFMRYFFSRVDHFIAEGSGLSTATYYSQISQARGKDVYHIEHILAHDEEGFNKGLFADEDEFNIQRNRLGDLLLLKGKDNQSSGNELYSQKLKTYVGNGTLFAQTLLPSFEHNNKGFQRFCAENGLSFSQYEQYDKHSIEERQKLLFEIVKIIWA